MFLAATTPGGRGGKGVLSHVMSLISHFGGNVIVDFSLPSFYDNFKEGVIIDSGMNLELNTKINQFQKSIS